MPGISNRVLKSSVVEKESETTNSSVAGGMTDSGDNGAKINEIEIVNADKNESLVQILVEEKFPRPIWIVTKKDIKFVNDKTLHNWLLITSE